LGKSYEAIDLLKNSYEKQVSLSDIKIQQKIISSDDIINATLS
jgi:hypothetical protein